MKKDKYKQLLEKGGTCSDWSYDYNNVPKFIGHLLDVPATRKVIGLELVKYFEHGSLPFHRNAAGWIIVPYKSDNVTLIKLKNFYGFPLTCCGDPNAYGCNAPGAPDPICNYIGVGTGGLTLAAFSGTTLANNFEAQVILTIDMQADFDIGIKLGIISGDITFSLTAIVKIALHLTLSCDPNPEAKICKMTVFPPSTWGPPLGRDGVRYGWKNFQITNIKGNNGIIGVLNGIGGKNFEWLVGTIIPNIIEGAIGKIPDFANTIFTLMNKSCSKSQ
jgi:hypothetical protein